MQHKGPEGTAPCGSLRALVSDYFMTTDFRRLPWITVSLHGIQSRRCHKIPFWHFPFHNLLWGVAYLRSICFLPWGCGHTEALMNSCIPWDFCSLFFVFLGVLLSISLGTSRGVGLGLGIGQLDQLVKNPNFLERYLLTSQSHFNRNLP